MVRKRFACSDCVFGSCYSSSAPRMSIGTACLLVGSVVRLGGVPPAMGGPFFGRSFGLEEMVLQKG